MADATNIEWTDATWTPIRARNKATGKVGWHCEHASPGCMNCYSETFNEKRLGTGLAFKPGHRDDVEHFLDEAMLIQPLRWRRPRMVFVCSMTDLFGDWVPDEWIDRVFAVMAMASQHTFQVLTKRADRMRRYLTADGGFGPWGRVEHRARQIATIPLGKTLAHLGGGALPHVWLGVSAEDQRRADERVPILLGTPAAVRWVSAEPLLGPIDFTRIAGDIGVGLHSYDALRGLNIHHDDGDQATGVNRIDWIVVGGESGPDARPMHPSWARSIRDQCATAGVPFLFKQWGAWGRAAPKPSGTTGRYAFASAPPHSDFMPAMIVPIDTYPRQIDLFGGAIVMELVGKKAAGRRLDGVLHDGFPGRLAR